MKNCILLTITDRYEDMDTHTYVLANTDENKKLIKEMQEAIDNFMANENLDEDYDGCMWDDTVAPYLDKMDKYDTSEFNVVY